MKRFSDTSRFDKAWYSDLPIEFKMAWEYVWAKCDHAGAWEPNLQLADFQIGKKINWPTFRERMTERIFNLPTGEWMIAGFVEVQCGQLTESCRAHLPVISKLKQRGLIKPDSLSIVYPVTINSHKELEKEEYKEKKEGMQGERKDRSTQDEIVAFCISEGLTESDGKATFNKWIGNGWKNGTSPIKCWRSTIRSWKASGYMPSQKNGNGSGTKHVPKYDRSNSIL